VHLYRGFQLAVGIIGVIGVLRLSRPFALTTAVQIAMLIGCYFVIFGYAAWSRGRSERK